MLTRASHAGFNLIEAAVTVSILGILVATALPSMTDWMRSTRVRGVAEATLSGLQKARNEAMRRNKIVTFWLVTPRTTTLPGSDCALASDSAAWVVSMDNPASHCDTAPSDTVAPRIIEAYGPGEAGAVVAVAARDREGDAATSVSFNGYGQAIQTGTPISDIDIQHAEAAGRRLRIQISSSGGVRVCDIDVAATDPRACN